MMLKSVRVELQAQMALSPIPLNGFEGYGTICQVNGRIFLEQQNPNGTYGLMEVSTFAQGLIVSTLSVDLEAARAAQYGLHYLPDISGAIKERGESAAFNFNFDQGSFILDNRNLTPQQVLSVTKHVVYQTVLRKLASAKRFSAKSIIKLNSR